MDDKDFFNNLVGEDQQNKDLVDGAEHFIRLKKQVGTPTRDDSFEKEAGLASNLINSIKSKAHNLTPAQITMLGLGGAGAVAGAAITRHGSVPREELGGRSKAEAELEGKVISNQNKPEDGLLNKMRNRNTELEHGYSKAFRDHPNKAALIGAGTGALGGYSLGRIGGITLDMLRKRRGK